MMSFLKRFILGEESRPEGPRLRHLYQFAVLLEDGGADYYKSIAGHAQDKALAKLSLQLAGEELKHKQLFEELLSKWTPLPLDPESFDALVERFKAKGVFSVFALANKTVDELVRHAVELEQKSVDFYLSFEKDFADAWKRIQMHRIVEEERAHVDKLSLFLSNIRNTQLQV